MLFQTLFLKQLNKGFKSSIIFNAPDKMTIQKSKHVICLYFLIAKRKRDWEISLHIYCYDTVTSQIHRKKSPINMKELVIWDEYHVHLMDFMEQNNNNIRHILWKLWKLRHVSQKWGCEILISEVVLIYDDSNKLIFWMMLFKKSRIV